MNAAVSTADPANARSTMLRICGAAFAAYASYSICRAPLLPLFADSLGAGPSLVGVVMGASTLTGVFLKLPSGALSDIVGRGRLLLAGALVFATLPFTYLAVSSLGLLIVLRAIHGSATAIFGPVATASLADVAPAGRRGAWLSAYSTAQGSGQTIGPLIAGYLLAANRFDLAFFASGLIGVAVPLVVLGWPEWRASPHSSSSRRSFGEFAAGIREVARDRLVLITSAAHAALFVLNGTLNAFLPLYARAALRLSTAELGWLFAVQTITTLAIRPGIGLLSDRVGRRWVIVTGLTICSLAVFGLSLASTVTMVVAVIVTYASGVAITTAATSAYVTDVTRSARYGTAHGVFGTIYDIGDALGPLVGGALAAGLGFGRMFQVMSACTLTMGVGFALTTRKIR